MFKGITKKKKLCPGISIVLKKRNCKHLQSFNKTKSEASYIQSDINKAHREKKSKRVNYWIVD